MNNPCIYYFELNQSRPRWRSLLFRSVELPHIELSLILPFHIGQRLTFIGHQERFPMTRFIPLPPILHSIIHRMPLLGRVRSYATSYPCRLRRRTIFSTLQVVISSVIRCTRLPHFNIRSNGTIFSAHKRSGFSSPHWKKSEKGGSVNPRQHVYLLQWPMPNARLGKWYRTHKSSLLTFVGIPREGLSRHQQIGIIWFTNIKSYKEIARFWNLRQRQWGWLVRKSHICSIVGSKITVQKVFMKRWTCHRYRGRLYLIPHAYQCLSGSDILNFR